MIWRFPPLVECMSNALASFGRALELHSEQPSRRALRDADFADGMLSIFGVQVSGTGTHLPTPDLTDFRLRVVELISPDQGGLNCYIDDSVEFARNRWEEEWIETCIRRSAIQLLWDEYPGGASLFGDEDRELVSDLDQLLHDAVPSVEMDSLPYFFKNLPDGHWWCAN